MVEANAQHEGAGGAQRSTKQRRAVAAELASSDDFRSAQEIHLALRRSGIGVGLATVYRALQAMADTGEVDVLTHSDEAVYRRCSESHHHHLVCRDCGRAVEIKGPAVERWTTSIAEKHGFHDVSHDLEVFGICPDCHGGGARPRSRDGDRQPPAPAPDRA